MRNFILGLNAAKNMEYLEKYSNKSYAEFDFLQKTQGMQSLSNPAVKLGVSKTFRL